MSSQNDSDPSISWSTIISSAAFMVAIIGGGWTVFQTQFNGLGAQIVENKTQIDKTASYVQAQMDRRFSEIGNALNSLHDERLTRNEFNQFSANMLTQFDIIRKQLSVIEQTRPTTGELQATSRGATDIINKLDDRLRSLEQYFMQFRIQSSTQPPGLQAPITPQRGLN